VPYNSGVRRPLANERILVVDDEEAIREVVSTLLGLPGLQMYPGRETAAWPVNTY